MSEQVDSPFGYWKTNETGGDLRAPRRRVWARVRQWAVSLVPRVEAEDHLVYVAEHGNYSTVIDYVPADGEYHRLAWHRPRLFPSRRMRVWVDGELVS